MSIKQKLEHQLKFVRAFIYLGEKQESKSLSECYRLFWDGQLRAYRRFERFLTDTLLEMKDTESNNG